MLNALEDRLGDRPKSLLDPFMGSGASIAAAVQLGISATGFDRFALGVLIARLRLEPPADLDVAVSVADAFANIAVPDWVDPEPTVVEWMGLDNARIVAAYRKAFENVEDVRLRRFLLVSISSALRPSSRWLAGSIKAQVDPNRTPSDLRLQLKRTARAISRDCQLERSRAKACGTAHTGDARNLIGIASGSFDAILTSPPYWTTYDYISTQRLTYLAFGWPVHHQAQIGRRYGINPDGQGFSAPSSMTAWYADFGAERTTTGRALREYIQRIRKHLSEGYRVLRPGGVAAYAIANSTRRQKVFDLAAAFAEMAQEVGFIEPEIVERTISKRRILPAGRDLRTGRFSSDFRPAIKEQALYLTRPPADRRRPAP